ncbi:TPA: HTH-type transcriptional regulator MalT [Escherichia coli]|nr:HTH-type transcriptional regulator MalT [Escherichia coli]
MLIPSKLSRPVRLDHTVVRERLLAKLSGANNFRLALITSPAGYGKTTLISQWAAGKNDIGWYSLDEGDNQQERFASYLIAAVQQATNGHCAICETMAQKRQYASLTSLFAQLFIELAEWHSPLYLVIDDYHLITNPVIHESMRFFIRHQPENLTLVVLSRNLPQLGIANLRVRDQLLEESLKALPWDSLLENPQLVLLQAWLMQSQHRYGEVNTLLARAEHEIKDIREGTMHAEFNALRAQVAINDGNPDEAERLAKLALEELPPGWFYSRIVATSVLGEVLHCKGELTRSLALMQQTEQMARQHDVWHYALWSLIQQSEILFAQGFLQTAWETQEKAFQLINEQHLEQLPMHEFLVRIRAQLLWAWARLDEAEASARSGIEVLSSYQPQQQLQCLAMLIQCSLARGDLDNARSQLNRLENLLGNGKYHSDWISNANKVRVIYWQMTSDKAAAANWLRHTAKPEFANNHFLQGQWRNIARAQILLGEFESAEIVLEELNENARSLRLMSDLNRNLLLLNQLYWQAGRKSDAQRVLLDALKLANRTGFISHFVIEGEAMAQQLRQLIQLNTLPELEQHRAQRILREINQHHRHKFAHFDENFVERLLNHPEVPELIRTSPLTQREWQVLGLIYSGYSNEQIAGELEVAATTIKTHIRNLYQKLGVAHRQAAVQHAQKLLKMMGYGV